MKHQLTRGIPARIMMLVVVFAICVIAPSLRAQSTDPDAISVVAEVSRSSVYVGDELTYQVVIRGSKNARKSTIDFPDSVRVRAHSPSSQSLTTMRDVNGVRRSVTERSFIYQYTLTAMSEGRVDIPAPELVIDGVTYTGNAVSFEALLPVRSDADEMEIIIERDELYQNETAIIECVWWIGDQTSEFNFSSSAFPESFELRPVPLNTSGQYKVDFTLNGQQMSGIVETETRNGVQKSRFSFRMSITPTQTGRFVLGPLRAIFTRHSGTGSRFRSYAESEPVEVRVSTVPQDGRPPNYEGAIGQYQLVARAANSVVNVGDPIQLTLRIRGSEPMIGVHDAPDLELDPAFVDRFRIDSQGWREITPRTNGTRVYETTIRALDDRVSQIPPIELPSFNPELGTYKVYRSAPLPLSVTSVKEVTLADALVSAGSEMREPVERAPVDRIELTTASPGLWAHGSADDIRNGRGFNLAQTLGEPRWQTALVAPPSLYLCVLAVAAYKRSRDPVLQRLKSAFREAKRQRGIDALRVYLARAVQIEPEAVTSNDANLLPIDQELRESLIETLLSAEGNARDAGDGPAHAQGEDLLRAVHQQCLRQHQGGEA